MKNNALPQPLPGEEAAQVKDVPGRGGAEPLASAQPPRIGVVPARAAQPEFEETSPHRTEVEPMKERPWKGWLAVLAGMIVIGGIVWSMTREPAASTPAERADAGPLELAAVDVALVEERVLSRSLPLSGSIMPVVQATVKSKVGGEVEQVTVREGQDVSKGDVIARIDTRNLQAQYDREMASVEKARADLNLAELNRDKNRAMLDQHFISQNTYESTESAYAGSVASLKLAEAQARVARIALEDAVIRAPFAGTIARRLVQPGEKVSTDSSVVTLVDLRQMLLEAALPAADIPSVRVGQKVHFNVGGFGDREFRGEVQRINPIAADGSRAITIYVAVPNEDGALKGGMFAQGELTLEATDPVLAVPTPAVHQEAGQAFVYTLTDGKIVRRVVTLGSSIEGESFAEVREGLSRGEQVIVADISDTRVGKDAFVRGAHAANQG